MKQLLLFLLVSLPFVALSQTDSAKYESMQGKLSEQDGPLSFATIEVLPQFPGGQAGWGKFLSENINYPAKAIKEKIAGRVVLTFIVEKSGELSNIKLIRGIGGGCDEEAMRVLKMSPPWKPGYQNGRPVRVIYTMPISFNL